MADFTGLHPGLLEPIAKEIFFRYIENEPESFPRFFNVKTSTKAYEDAMEVAGFNGFALKGEGTPIGYKNAVTGSRRRITMSTYALGYRVTMEMLEDDQFDIITQMPAELAKAAVDHRNRLAYGLYNDAFAGATYTGMDGLALCVTNHTFLNNGANTQSNALNPPAPLSVQALEAINVAARSYRDEVGRFAPVEFDTMLLPPALMYQAQVILETQYEPGGPNNDINTMARSRTGMEPVSVPYLTSTTAWFVVNTKNKRLLPQFWNRKVLTHESSKDAQTKDALYDAHYRAGVGFRKYHSVYGSNAA